MLRTETGIVKGDHPIIETMNLLHNGINTASLVVFYTGFKGLPKPAAATENSHRNQ